MAFIKKYHYFPFLFVWTLLNFFQAGNTVLLNDEAYYWVYSNFLAWGYFDHPPMIAALIKAGYYLFHTELGVRFFIVILNTLTLIIIHSLLRRKDDILFYAITCSVSLLQLGGFIAAPDIPLVFFAALFFMTYKKFLASFSWTQTILLGVVMAAMLYSKYHGVLIILFTLVSNPALLKNSKAYVAVAIAGLLFIPHLYWQYRYGFPSIQYHLFERSQSSYKFSYTLEYIGGQLLLAGPIMGWLFFWSAYKYRYENLFEKSLRFSFVGMYVFFLLTTFKGRVEANWTVSALIPLIILSHQYLYDKIRLRKILLTTLPFSLALIMFIRFYLISENKFIEFWNTNEFEQNKEWAKKINIVSKGKPVVFVDSYQKASKYWFYSGIQSFSLNTPGYRRNNYNFWPVEKTMQGRSVYVMYTGDPIYFTDSVKTSAGILRGRKVDSFFSHSDIKLELKGEFHFSQNKNLLAEIRFNDPGKMNADTTGLQFQIYIYKEAKIIASYRLLITGIDAAKGELATISSVPVQLPAGNYFARLSISTCLPGYFSLNSTNLKLTIK